MIQNKLGKALALLLIIFFQINLGAQEVELRDVSKEELLKTESDIDNAAGAEILYYNKQVYYDVGYTSIELITEVHKRIKFYNNRPEDLSYATEEIYLFVEGEPEEISKIKAYTYNLVGEEIEETKLDKSQIFEKELSRRFKEVSFTMPKVQKGSVVDIYYKLRSPYFVNIDEFQFQFDIPAKKVEAKIYTPEDFIFNKISKGAVFPRFKLESVVDQRLGGKANVYNYEIENVPALKNESYVDNIENYRAGVLFELTSIVDSYGVPKHFSKTWQDVARSIASKEDYDEKMRRTNIFEDDIDVILSNATEKKSLETINNIFNHVKNNLKWNEEKSKYFDRGIRSTYKDKTGNSADINLTLVSMLRYAGFNSSPVVISTKDNLKPLFPTVDRLNYVIAYVILGEEEYYLDATDKYSEVNILPIRDYNWNGVMVDTPNRLWKLIDLKEPESSKYVGLVNTTIKENGEVEGKVKTKKTNHYSYLFRKKYFSMSEEDFIRDKESMLDDVLISDYTVKNAKAQGSIEEEYSFKYDNASEVILDKIFIKPIMFFADNDNSFKAEERSFPVDFIYSFKDKHVINMKIPDGYEVTSMPKSTKLTFGENLGDYQYIISNNGNFIRLTIDLNINTNVVMPNNYNFLKTFYSEKIKKESEQIVLTKIK